MSAEAFASSFSSEWRELIRIFLYYGNACEKAERWLQRKRGNTVAGLGQIPGRKQPSRLSLADGEYFQRSPLHGWHDLITDLIENAPFLDDDVVVKKERIIFIPTIPLRNLLIFMGEHKDCFDDCDSYLLSLFIHKNINRFDSWCRFAICKSNFNSISYDNNGWDFLAGEDQHLVTGIGTKLFSDEEFTIKIANRTNELLVPQEDARNFMQCKVDTYFNEEAIVCKESATDATKKVSVERNVKKGYDYISESSNDIQDAKKDTIPLKKAVLESDFEVMEIIKRISEYDTVCHTEKEHLDANNSHLLTVQAMPVGEETRKDSKLGALCNASIPSDEIDNILYCIEMMTQDQLVHFTTLLCSEQVTISSHMKEILLKKSLLLRLLSTGKTASRQVYNCVMKLVTCNSCSKECIRSVIVPLMIQSHLDSPQEDFILKILKSSSLDCGILTDILQCSFELYNNERTVSEAYLKSLEVILRKGLSISSRHLFEIVSILQMNAAKFERMAELPKVILLMIKNYKEEVTKILNSVNVLLHTNKSFLKNKALKELSKVYDDIE